MCRIAGVYYPKGVGKRVARKIYYELFAQQHGGQESAGIVTNGGEKKGMGLVSQVFSDEKDFEGLSGHMGVGHVRYSTQGASSIENVQPFVFKHKRRKCDIAYNGNLANNGKLTRDLEDDNAIFQTSTDTEVFAHRFTRTKGSTLERLTKTFDPSYVKGAYSVLFMDEKAGEMYAIRDPNGFRPLCLGKFSDGGYTVASEDIAFEKVGADFIREIEPGEILKISNNGLESSRPKLWGERDTSHCVKEWIYFANPASEHIFGKSVAGTQMALGKYSAREQHIDADLVIPMPNSALFGALGYHEESGIPFGWGLVANGYVGRTFIKPTQEEREMGVNMKLTPIKSIVRGKRIIVVDDTIIRGTTSKNRILDLKNAGAREVYVAITSMPTRHDCFYGLDISSKNGELIANRLSVDEIRDYIGADGLVYLSEEGMLKATGHEDGKGLCYACMTGKYPIEASKGYCNGKC